MAEIHVQPKKHTGPNTTWIWIVIALLIVATVVYFVVKNNETAPNDTTTPAYPTSQVQGVNDLIQLNAA